MQESKKLETHKRYYVFENGKFTEMTIDNKFFETHPVLWSARLSVGIFGLTSCPSGNSGPKSSNEVILGVGNEGLAEFVKMGFVPCPVCSPEKSPNFNWPTISGAVEAQYGISSASDYADKKHLPFDARRIEWVRIISAIHDAPDRIYLPEGLGAKEVESFRTLLIHILQINGVAREPSLGYYSKSADGHFTEYPKV